MDIKFYQIENKYIDYLSPHAPHLFHNKQVGQQNERKYIGIILQVNGFDYFAPLSSFKPKHNKMPEMIDFIKIKKYAVINLNNMFPVPLSECLPSLLLSVYKECHTPCKEHIQSPYNQTNYQHID